MARWFAGIAAVLLIISGGVLALQTRAEEPPLPPAPAPGTAGAGSASPLPAAPEADPKSKEERRFQRSDKNEDGRITLAEMVEPRRKAFDRLDINRDGKLGFEEWAVKTIDKFEDADSDSNKALTPAEFASTAPKTRKKPACSC